MLKNSRAVKSQLKGLGIDATVSTHENGRIVKARVDVRSLCDLIREENRVIELGYSIQCFGQCHPDNLSPSKPSQMKDLQSAYLTIDLWKQQRD